MSLLAAVLMVAGMTGAAQALKITVVWTTSEAETLRRCMGRSAYGCAYMPGVHLPRGRCRIVVNRNAGSYSAYVYQHELDHCEGRIPYD